MACNNNIAITDRGVGNDTEVEGVQKRANNRDIDEVAIHGSPNHDLDNMQNQKKHRNVADSGNLSIFPRPFAHLTVGLLDNSY